MAEGLLDLLLDAFVAKIIEKSIIFILLVIMVVALGLFSRYLLKQNDELRKEATKMQKESYDEMKEDRDRNVNALVENTRALQTITTILEMMKK